MFKDGNAHMQTITALHYVELDREGARFTKKTYIYEGTE